MKRILTGVALVALLGTVVAPPASAFRAWQLITQETIEGVWEAIDYDRLEVCRLVVKDGTAVLVITSGAKQAEFVFQSAEVRVKAGKVSLFAVETTGGPKLRITGAGKVLDGQGRMTLRMVNLTRELTYWENTERLFVKGMAKPRLDALIEMDMRANALVAGTAQPCCAAHGSPRSEKSPNEAQSKDAKKTE